MNRFRSLTIPPFWDCFSRLPLQIQDLAVKQYELFTMDPQHPSLHFKPIGPYWSVRINREDRALALRDGDLLHWFWLGNHADYDRLIRRA